MYVAAWKLFVSRIVHLKGDCGLTTRTMDSDVFCFDLKTSGLTQLSHSVHDLAVVPTRSDGGPGKAEQIFVESVLLHVHGDDSVR